MDYKELNQQLQGRNKDSRKHSNNTYIVRRNGNIALQLHQTDVATFQPDGAIILNSGGWHTLTTKDRINQALPAGLRLSQAKGIWWLKGQVFKDGITINPNGTITGQGKSNPKADVKLKKQVRAYAKLCADAVPMEPPGAGDCWYCAMVTTNKQTLGDAFKDASHLDSHIKEGYVVPSLVYHALKESGNTDFILTLIFKNPDKAMLDVAQERVQRSVYRYILKRKDYAC